MTEKELEQVIKDLEETSERILKMPEQSKPAKKRGKENETNLGNVSGPETTN